MQSDLTKNELRRYIRQLILPNFDVSGQRRLKSSSVLVVGAGGLGCPILLYLTAAGVGRIGVIDFDTVCLSNLHRQILYTEADVDAPKSVVATERLEKLNKHTEINTYQDRLSNENALTILGQYDVIVDGTDNFMVRYLINDACVFLDKPLVYGSVYQFEGQVSVFNHSLGEGGGRSACYRCLYPSPPPTTLISNCTDGGVLGTLPGIIGSIQAHETIKLLTGIGCSLVERLFTYDSLLFETDVVCYEKDRECAVCSEKATITEFQDYHVFCSRHDGRDQPIKQMSVKKFKQKIQEQSDYQLVDVREPYEREISSIGGVSIPLRLIQSDIQSAVTLLSTDKNIIFYCRDGSRSKLAISLLEKEYSLMNLYNLSGGIQEWSLKIDDSVTLY